MSAQVWFFHDEPILSDNSYINIDTDASATYLVRSLLDFANWFMRCHGYYDENAMRVQWLVQEVKAYQEGQIAMYKKMGLQMNPVIFTEKYGIGERLNTNSDALYAMTPRGLTVYKHRKNFKTGQQMGNRSLSYSDYDSSVPKIKDLLIETLV